MFVGALVLLYCLTTADPNPYYPIVWMTGMVILTAAGIQRTGKWFVPLLAAFAVGFALNTALAWRHVGAQWNTRAFAAIQRAAGRVPSSGRGMGESFLYLALRDVDYTGFTFVEFAAAKAGTSRWQVVESIKPDWIVTMRDEDAFTPPFAVMSVDVPHMRLQIPDAALAGAYELGETVATDVGVFEIWRHKLLAAS